MKAQAKRPHKPSKFGIFLASLKPNRWLYPVYAARQLRLEKHEISSSHVPRSLSGLKLAYASDIHYGALLDKERVTDLADRLNALDADIVLLGGDYGEDAAHSLEFWQIVPPLHARLAVCGVVGNHDRADGDIDALCAAMQAKGVTPLVNNAVMLRGEDGTIAVCATDDCYWGNPDYSGTAAQVCDADFVIYAPHAPDALEDAYNVQKDPFFDLALCGHSHGGQVALLGFAPYTASRRGLIYGNHYRSGLIDEYGVNVLVSNGVGTTWLPIRFGARAQYHLITLNRARPQ